MRGLGDGARTLLPPSVIQRVTAVVALSGLAALLTAVPSWAGSGTGSNSDTGAGVTGAGSAAVPGPEVLGIPLLTVAWAISGLLAVLIGLVVASRRVTQRAVSGPAEIPADRADPAPDRDRR